MPDRNMAFGLASLGWSVCLLLLCYIWWWRRLKRPLLRPFAAVQSSASAIDELEQSIRGNLPPAIKAAYLGGRTAQICLPITFQSNGVEYLIISFFAADAQSNKKLADLIGIPANAFIFATDDFDNYYFVEASKNAVYFWDHEGGDISQAFESAEAFLSALQS